MICPGCLIEKEEEGYCKKCLKELFGGKKVSHVLPFNPPAKDQSGLYLDLMKKLSISGVQIKYSMKLEDGRLVFTEKGGQYILKPFPIGQFQNLDQAPANEHLTMQIARQFFKIDVPPNATIVFNDGSPAYLVKRFDVKADGKKYQQEDFAQIARISEETHGKNYKYDLSYEEIAGLIKQYVSMYPIEMEKFFRLILFNYAFSNGDAHVRNFSAIKTDPGDYVLTPAYDLLCTRIHSPQEHDMALTLFSNSRFSEAYRAIGFYTQFDFLEFGKIVGIKESRVIKLVDEFKSIRAEIIEFVRKSFLREDIKHSYIALYTDRIARLNSKLTLRQN